MLIVTDCAADMPLEEADRLGVAIAPLYIHYPEGETDACGLDADAFYQRLRHGYPEIPTTSQPSAGEFARLYTSLAQGYDQGEILSIHISSGLSGTFQSAGLGSRQVDGAEVVVVDSRTMAGGQRFQVLAAAQGARRGWPFPPILDTIADIRERTEVVYALETLEYLRRGGRIGRVEGVAGSLLRVKPVIHVEHADGKYSVVAKAWTMSGLIRAMARYLRGVYGPDLPLWVTVQHGQRPELAQCLAAELQSRLHVARMETLRVSPILGVHSGPGVVGASVVPMEAFGELIPEAWPGP